MKTMYLLALTATIFGLFATGHSALAENAASFAKIDVTYNPSTNILEITGLVYKTFSQNYVLTIFNPQGHLISVSQLHLSQNDTFSQSIVAAGQLWSEPGNYTVKVASGPVVLSEKSSYFPGASCCVKNSHGIQAGLQGTVNAIGSPLEQFRSGIMPKDVACNSGLHLVIKSEDGSPACVRLDTAYMLIKRGWASSESAYPEGNAQFALDPNSTIIPGNPSRPSGLQLPYGEWSQGINYSGFDGVYNQTLSYDGLQDYVLKPGSTGTITFKLDAQATELPGQTYPIPLPKSLNLTNYAVFYHEITSPETLSKYPGVTFHGNREFDVCFTRPGGGSACMEDMYEGKTPIEAYEVDHPGVNVLFEPPAEVLPLGTNVTSQQVTMTVTADGDAPKGTYWVRLFPLGLDSFLLTVGSQPYHE